MSRPDTGIDLIKPKTRTTTRIALGALFIFVLCSDGPV